MILKIEDALKCMWDNDLVSTYHKSKILTIKLFEKKKKLIHNDQKLFKVRKSQQLIETSNGQIVFCK
jgi:hypothetical protein